MAQPGYVQIGDTTLDQRLLVRTEIRQRLNDHWWCVIECRDTLGNAIEPDKLLGAPCRVSNWDELGQEHVAFDGIFVDVAVTREVWGSYSAKLTAASPSWLLDQGTRKDHYATASVAEVASSIAGHAGLSAAVELAARERPAEYLQWKQTDWQFLLRLADDHGGWIRSLGGTLELRNTFDAAIPLVFRGEQSLLEFAIEGQLRPQQLSGAHYDREAALSSTFQNVTAQPAMLPAGQAMASAAQSGAATSGLLGGTVRSRSVLLADHHTRLAAEAEREQGSAVLAFGVSREPAVCAGVAIQVSNLNEASGVYNVIEATHVWTVKGYENHFTATPWSAWRSPARPAAAKANGFAIGAVTGNYDPTGQGRIQVQYTWQSEPNQPAPLASVLAGADLGMVLVPEIGDEVVVSFTDGDPERPVVLGCLWNGVHQPPRHDFRGADAAPNNVKRLVTKSGIRITISDKPGEESIALATPRSSRLLMTERADETGRPAIAMYTEGDILLDAGNRIHMNAGQITRHVDGKIMHPIGIRLVDGNGNSASYRTEVLSGTLTNGTKVQQQIVDGQHFPSIPEGNCTFAFPHFLDFGNEEVS